jgi:hypothetical protein
MTVEQRLAETLSKLTPAQRVEVLDFAEFLQHRIQAEREGQRPFGLAAGDFTVPDDFDDPLPADELGLFEQ